MQAEVKLTVVMIESEDELRGLREALHKQLRETLPEPYFTEEERATFFAHATLASTMPKCLADKVRNAVEESALLPILRTIWFLGVTSN